MAVLQEAVGSSSAAPAALGTGGEGPLAAAADAGSGVTLRWRVTALASASNQLGSALQRADAAAHAVVVSAWVLDAEADPRRVRQPEPVRVVVVALALERVPRAVRLPQLVAPARGRAPHELAVALQLVQPAAPLVREQPLVAERFLGALRRNK